MTAILIETITAHYKKYYHINCEKCRWGLWARARGVRGEGARGPHSLSQIQIARIYAHSSPTGIYLTLLFTYPFICFAPISPDREFLCLHAPGPLAPGPGACPRKAATCQHFTATITQFSSKRSTFIGLYGNNLTLLTPVNIFVCTAAWAWLITPVCCPYPGALTCLILVLSRLNHWRQTHVWKQYLSS